MKKTFFYCVMMLSLQSGILIAQTDAERISNRSGYIEAGGSSVVFSFNYDFRFDKTAPEGWGMKMGMGGYAVGDNYMFTAPIMVNYLIGKRSKYFEGAAGIVPGFSDTEIFWLTEGSFPVAGCVYVGYRYQPSDRGIVFRAGVPFFFGSYAEYDWTINADVNRFFATPLWPGVSFGYAF